MDMSSHAVKSRNHACDRDLTISQWWKNGDKLKKKLVSTVWNVVYIYMQKRITPRPFDSCCCAACAGKYDLTWFAWDKSQYVSFQALVEQTVWKGQLAINQEIDILWVWGYSDHDDVLMLPTLIQDQVYLFVGVGGRPLQGDFAQ